jgi:hypothetical protein
MIWKREVIQYETRCPHESKEPRVMLKGSSNIAYDLPKKHLPLLTDRHEDEKETNAAAFRLSE